MTDQIAGLEKWQTRSVTSAGTNVSIDGRSLLFTPKQGFGPCTAKSQSICTHLLLYGIYLWANLDCDRRVSGSRPNQNDYVYTAR